MGTSRNAAQLAGKLDKWGELISGNNAENVKAVAQFIKDTALAGAAGPTGGDLVFSNNRKRKIGVRYDLLSGGQDAKAKVKATGPMSWLEDGVKRHGVAPKGLGGSRASRVAAAASIARGSRTSFGTIKEGRTGVLRFADGTFSRYSRNAGGLPARHTWSKAVDVAEARQGEIHAKSLLRSGTAIFG